jgi:hypothetical protein
LDVPQHVLPSNSIATSLMVRKASADFPEYASAADDT